jgi:hypothetical protein
MSNDRGMHAPGILQDLMVPESQNPVALAFQKATAFRFLRRRSIVLTAVDFDNQPRFMASKIGNVPSERYLATELVPLNLPRP